MLTTHLEFIRDNSIKGGITYPLFNADKEVFTVYFNSDLDYRDMVDTLADFAKRCRPDYRLYCMLKHDWDILLDALKGASNRLRVSLKSLEYYSYYKPLK